MMNEREPQTLIEAVRYFADGAACQEYMRTIKWPEGKVTCPHCQGDNIGRIETRRLYKCRACKKQFSDKTDTIFEDSPERPLLSNGVWCVKYVVALAKSMILLSGTEATAESQSLGTPTEHGTKPAN